MTKRTWSACFNVTPVAKGRPKFTRKGFAYTPGKTRAAEKDLKVLIAASEPPLFKGPVALNIIFSLRRPKSAKNRKYPTCRPDLDNFLKLFFDSANGLVFEDDSQVVQIVAVKQYGQHSAITVHALELETG